MKDNERTKTETRLSKAWYVKYDWDTYGPLRYEKPVGADEISDIILKMFGSRPHEIWPEGNVVIVPEYEFLVSAPVPTKNKRKK